MSIDPPKTEPDSNDGMAHHAVNGGGIESAASQPTEIQDENAVRTSIALSGPPRIPGYDVTKKLGAGAFGEVWRAVQLHTQKEVAVKVFTRRTGVNWLFLQREVDRLVRLDTDPNVVTLLDAGLDYDPPFYVMELIAGGALAAYVKPDHRPSIETVIRWMTEIAEALAYIHGKGSIHCDLKPANVLIDEQGHVRVSDFGQSRVFTDASAALGTMFYMAPEQARVPKEDEPLQPDVRWDIYALGATIYALLAGHAPHETSGNQELLESASDLESRLAHYRMIVAEQPIEGWTERGAKLAHREFEAMVLKCLSPDPAHRYRTCQGVLNDLNALREHRPVTPLEPSRSYRVSKSLRRNRALVGGLSAVFIVLVAGVVVSTRQYIQADAARKEAERARTEATQRAQELEQVTEFQQSMLSEIDAETMGLGIVSAQRASIRAGLETEGADPERIETALALFDDLVTSVNATDLALKVVDENVLARAVETIHEEFVDQPVTGAALQQTVAMTYTKLGLYQSALPLQETCLRTRRRTLGNDHPDTLTSINAMGVVLESMGKLHEAEPYFREALEGKRRILGEDHPSALMSISNMGFLLQSMGKFTEAEPYYREALEGRRRVMGNDHPDTLTAINNMGSLLESMGKYTEAEPYYREALQAHRRVLGNDHPNTLGSINNMGSLLRSMGRYAEAEPYLREALAGKRRVLGNDHPSTLTSISNMGFLLQSMGKLDEAEPYLREALEGKRRVLGDDHPATLLSINNMGHLLNKLGRYRDAAEVLLAGETAARRVYVGDNARWLGNYLAKLGEARVGQGEFLAGEKTLLEAHALLSVGFGENHKRTRNTVNLLITLYGRWHAAEPSKGYAAKAAAWRAKRAKEEATDSTPP